jgi:glutathione-specific gamma-glutamylcyclotransferase
LRARPSFIFGYGSLLWRTEFPFVERHPGFVRGFARRFWQGSVDHRGVPGAPGRVVTLIEEPGAVCWGVAYRVEPTVLDEVLDGLDRRERGGYRRLETAFFGSGKAEPSLALTYVATPDNPNYLGPAPLEAIAAQVRAASGPSGSNLEYLVRLAGALEELGAADEHVRGLEELVTRSMTAS